MTTRDRRALVLGCGAILAAVLCFRVLPWAVRMAISWRAQVLDRQAGVARARDVLARASAVRDSLDRTLVAIVDLAPRLVDGHSAAEASASLSALVSLAANRHALKVVRVDPLPDSAAGVFRRVAVHAEFEGDAAGIGRLIRSVETGDPLLTVMSLAVDAPAPVPQRGVPEALRVQLDIGGFYLPKGAK
jgi:hypothetical protein